MLEWLYKIIFGEPHSAKQSPSVTKFRIKKGPIQFTTIDNINLHCRYSGSANIGRINFEIFILNNEETMDYKIGWGELQPRTDKVNTDKSVWVSQFLYIHPGNKELTKISKDMSPCGCDKHILSDNDYRGKNIMTTVLNLLEKEIDIYIVPSKIFRGNGASFNNRRAKLAHITHPIKDKANWGYRNG